tara:strand:+ start:8269 stop:8595 length:327 start_codon:yes stop_codon:yes gene_type:complete
MKFSDNDYRPLPKGLTVKESGIHGLGLFATENISSQTFLGESHVWSERKGGWIRTPIGGFINHSDNPNCSVNEEENGGIRELYAVKDIKPNEELTVYYSTKLGYGKGN